MNDIIAKIRAELAASADEQTKKSFQRFFKEKVTCYGAKTGLVGIIARKYWKDTRDLGKNSIFRICEELYRSDYCEEAFIVADWVPRLKKEFEPADLLVFKKWIEKYINNWAKCDGFCNHTIAGFVEKFPASIDEIKSWSKSDNRWMKRASAVSLIPLARRGEYLSVCFEIADALIGDDDDMVQKGYGWLLKEESRTHQKEVLAYVCANKKIMPRTALRYAIELMPENLRAKAMGK